MSEQVNEKELVAYIAEQSKQDAGGISLVLRYEQEFIGKARVDENGEVDIDIDDLVDYILGKKDIKLHEPEVEQILELEMDYLTEKGLAGYID
ncbi:hypothetical protein [Paenibacillus soyae]|uniref:Uncharacterized protein n=1 Tax=Paenibacillus soyae TaxID=2969249 RepID=A0A9X2MT88_9BACL|nr:hypothetical protein [Paenibacillus soyae]MCR2803307.1 hypothetical protein [Paenibacillus soyae]